MLNFLNHMLNFLNYVLYCTPPKPHTFVTNMLLSAGGPVSEPVNKPVPSRRYPACLEKGETV